MSFALLHQRAAALARRSASPRNVASRTASHNIVVAGTLRTFSSTSIQRPSLLTSSTSRLPCSLLRSSQYPSTTFSAKRHLTTKELGTWEPSHAANGRKKTTAARKMQVDSPVAGSSGSGSAQIIDGTALAKYAATTQRRGKHRLTSLRLTDPSVIRSLLASRQFRSSTPASVRILQLSSKAHDPTAASMCE